MNDTSPEVESMVRDRLMALTGEQRMRIGADMFESARRMVLASLPSGVSEYERRRLLFERVYGERWPGESCAELECEAGDE